MSFEKLQGNAERELILSVEIFGTGIVSIINKRGIQKYIYAFNSIQRYYKHTIYTNIYVHMHKLTQIYIYRYTSVIHST